jgi:hypothetical protein
MIGSLSIMKASFSPIDILGNIIRQKIIVSTGDG